MSKRVTNEDKLYALAVYMQNYVTFKPERHKDNAPAKHTVFYQMWSNKKLNLRQCQAADMIYHDALNAFGNSKGLTSSYEPRVDTSRSTNGYDPVVAENSAQNSLRRLVEHLSPDERELLVMVIREFDKNSKVEIDLRVLGSILSGYNSGDQARAAGTAHLQAFLNRCANFYGL